MPGLFNTPLLGAAPEQVKAALGAQVPFPPRLGNPPEYASLALQMITNPYFQRRMRPPRRRDKNGAEVENNLPLVGRSKNAEHFSVGAGLLTPFPPPEISSLRCEISTSPQGGGIRIAHDRIGDSLLARLFLDGGGRGRDAGGSSLRGADDQPEPHAGGAWLSLSRMGGAVPAVRSALDRALRAYRLFVPGPAPSVLGCEFIATGLAVLAAIRIFGHYFPEDARSHVLGSRGARAIREILIHVATLLPVVAGSLLLAGASGALYWLIPSEIISSISRSASPGCSPSRSRRRKDAELREGR